MEAGTGIETEVEIGKPKVLVSNTLKYLSKVNGEGT